MNNKPWPCRVYKGIRIYRNREMMPGSDLKELKNGNFASRKPQYFPATYSYAGGYPYDSVEECIASIESIKQSLIKLKSYDPDLFVKIMNSED